MNKSFKQNTLQQNAFKLIPLATLLLAAAFALSFTKKHGADFYGIYTARLDGSDMHLLLSSAQNEMTHPRVSPDNKLITFTRYRNPGPDGSCSEEGGGYVKTEIALANIDGTGVQILVPPRDGVVSANSSWTPDGKGILYCTFDAKQGIPHLAMIDLATRKIKYLPTPKGLKLSDPHWVGTRVVFPVTEPQRQVLWTMQADGSDAHQLTNPKSPPGTKNDPFRPGDYDPWLSPDASKVAFMRMMPDGRWHAIVLNVETGVEVDLSAKVPGVDAVPEWSSDGKLLLLWHADLNDMKSTGIYSIHPDGEERTMVPLPRGYKHMHPGFFSNDGSAPKARIIFNAQKLSSR